MISKTEILIGSIILLIIVLVTASVSAVLSVVNVDVKDINPGEQTTLKITVENPSDDDVEDVSLSLNFQGLPLSAVGSSEVTIKEIKEDDDDYATFVIRATPTATPGDYQIPFTLTYQNSSRAKTGFIGVRIKGSVDLSTVITAEKPVLNQKDKITFRIINKGFSDARYVSLNLVPNGFIVTSDSTVYIGDISANDFETASFDVIYTNIKPLVEATLEYKDFNNLRQTKVIVEELDIYTLEEAQARGIVEKSNAPMYITVVVVLIVLWIVWRAVRRRRRLNRSMSVPTH